MRFRLMIRHLFMLSLLLAGLSGCSKSSLQDKPSGQSNPNILTEDQKLERIESHDRAFLALNEKIRDPFILAAPDGYFYLTGTAAGSHWGDTIGIHLWRSLDLAKWESLGFVWDLYKDGEVQNSWHFSQPLKNPDFKNPRAVWAPEIHFLNSTFWIPHCLNISGHGLLRSTTGKAEGPYEVYPMIANKGIDAHLYQENGDTYYLWGADMIARMDKDMKGLAEEPEKLRHDGKHPLGYEGVLLLKFDDKYVHIASGRYGYEPTDTYDLYYAVSKNLKGPYGKRRMMIKNAGHGNLLQDHNGRWWSTAFDHAFIDPDNPLRWNCWLVPIDIEVTRDDVLVHVKDERFRPTAEDQAFVSKLAETGVPAAWEGKSPWWRPE
ncbi:MAG: family 43 glycosylhydrolase [Verrucomicrobiae bacterium]|nr:family 43 glycosylhydrolase [Verrucomicrobiae bacterium]